MPEQASKKKNNEELIDFICLVLWNDDMCFSELGAQPPEAPRKKTKPRTKKNGRTYGVKNKEQSLAEEDSKDRVELQQLAAG